MTSEIKRGQRGYALLMVLSFLAIMAVGATAAAVTWTTMGTREKESELAWRGNQYVRAIKLYYKKYGRYPKTLADLTDYHSGQPRFIRQAYKDPMNTKDDGAWRLIFVLPNGQLQGSVMHKIAFPGRVGRACSRRQSEPAWRSTESQQQFRARWINRNGSGADASHKRANSNNGRRYNARTGSATASNFRFRPGFWWKHRRSRQQG